jgi:hypothetical protein
MFILNVFNVTFNILLIITRSPMFILNVFNVTFNILSLSVAWVNDK